MDALAKTYLSGVEIHEDSYITGYTEDENSCKELLSDIDNRTGGFVRLYTKNKENDDGKMLRFFISEHGLLKEYTRFFYNNNSNLFSVTNVTWKS